MLDLQESEFCCKTCKTNMLLDKIIEFTNNNELKNNYIPIQLRVTTGVGLIFTKNSIIYNWHEKRGQHHEWGNYRQMQTEAQQKEIEQLDSITN